MRQLPEWSPTLRGWFFWGGGQGSRPSSPCSHACTLGICSAVAGGTSCYTRTLCPLSHSEDRISWSISGSHTSLCQALNTNNSIFSSQVWCVYRVRTCMSVCGYVYVTLLVRDNASGPGTVLERSVNVVCLLLRLSRWNTTTTVICHHTFKTHQQYCMNCSAIWPQSAYQQDVLSVFYSRTHQKKLHHE